MINRKIFCKSGPWSSIQFSSVSVLWTSNSLSGLCVPRWVGVASTRYSYRVDTPPPLQYVAVIVYDKSSRDSRDLRSSSKSYLVVVAVSHWSVVTPTVSQRIRTAVREYVFYVFFGLKTCFCGGFFQMNLKMSLAKVADVPVARTAGIAEEMGCRG